MIIGLPKALLYFRYGALWEAFFTALGCGVVVSGDTDGATHECGERSAMSECCLPAKIYLGHVKSLIGRCDYILAPYASRALSGENMCVRFWGMCDTLRNTFRGAPLLEYAVIESDARAQFAEYRRMGKTLGKSAAETRAAYALGAAAQGGYDLRAREEQFARLQCDGLKILISAHPYVMHDPYIGGAVVKILSEQGCVPFYSDRFDRAECFCRAREISPRLYWTSNREAVGAVAAYKDAMDGAILLTAVPCAADALSCEMVLRKTRGFPMTRLPLDGMRGEAGLRTRLESFVDILENRRAAAHAR